MLNIKKKNTNLFTDHNLILKHNNLMLTSFRIPSRTNINVNDSKLTIIMWYNASVSLSVMKSPSLMLQYHGFY